MNEIIQDRLEALRQALETIDNMGFEAEESDELTLEDALDIIGQIRDTAHLAIAQDDGLEDIQPT